MKRIGRSILWILLLILGILLLFALILTWQPRSVPWLKAEVEQSISEALAPQRLETAQAVLGMDWTPYPHLTVQVHDAVLKDEAGRAIARFPWLETEFSLTRLLFGEFVMRHLVLQDAVIVVRIMEDGRYALGFREFDPTRDPPEEEETASAAEETAPMTLSRLPVRGVDVRRARLIMVNAAGVEKFDVPQLQFRRSAKEASLKLLLGKAPDPSRLAMLWQQESPGSEAHLAVDLYQFPVGPVVKALPQLTSLQGLSLSLNGQATLRIPQSGPPQIVEAQLESGQGTYENLIIFPEPLMIRSFKVGLQEENGALHIRQCSLKTDESDINLSGKLQVNSSGISGDLEGRVLNLPLDRIGHFWPRMLAPMTRDWVTANISGGMATEASARLRFTPEDLAAPTLPDAAVEAVIYTKDASIRYLDHLPPVTGVDGTIRITGETLTGTLTSGHSFTGTRLSEAKVSIPDFNDFTTPLQVSAKLVTNGADIATLLDEKHLNLARDLKLDATTLKGTAEGTLDMGLIIYPEEAGPVQDMSSIVNYRIDARLNGVGQKNLMGKWDVENLSGKFAANNASLTLEGTGRLQGVQGALGVAVAHEPFSATYRWRADMPAGRMPAFGVSLPEGITGVAALDATVTETPAGETTEARLNLARTDLLIHELGYRKPSGTPARLSLKHSSYPKDRQPVRFDYTSESEELQGEAVLDAEGALQSLTLPEARLNGNNLRVTWQQTPDGLRQLSFQGKSLNLGPVLEASDAQPEAGEDDWMNNLALTLDVAHVSLGEGRDLKDLKGGMTCRTDHCQTASISARTSQGKLLTYKIGQKEGRRHLRIESEDAGEILRVLRIARHVRNGTLNVSGEFDDGHRGRPLNGTVIMKEFALEDAPALTKLLSLLSLTGAADTVSGKGIRFTKLSGDIRYMGDDLIIKKASAYGPALGVTLEGEIANHGDLLALTGTLVPSYTANSLLGNIPLIGNVFVGKEGEGVFAARFSVKGPTDNPEVGVNPLSLLTPGFLRNLFEVTESTEANRVSEKDKQAESAKQPADTSE